MDKRLNSPTFIQLKIGGNIQLTKQHSYLNVSIFFVMLILIGASVGTAVSGFGGDNKRISFLVEESTAEVVAQAKLRQLENANFIIQDVEEITDDLNMKLGYLFTLHPQGYIVVAADYHLPPVIAYSFTSYPSEEAHSLFLELLAADLSLRLEAYDALPQDVLEQRHHEWDCLLTYDDELLGGRLFEQWPPEGTTPTGGWIETTWHQSPPYNNFCPIDLSSGQRSVAGCPAVAMAQILNYHTTINKTTFDDSDDYYHSYAGNNFWIDNDHETYDFPSFPELNGYLDVLTYHYQHDLPLTANEKAAITFACGVAATQVYNPGVHIVCLFVSCSPAAPCVGWQRIASIIVRPAKGII